MKMHQFCRHVLHALLAAGATASAMAADVATDPVGYIELKVPAHSGSGQTLGLLSLPLEMAPALTGSIASVNGNKLTLSSTWTGDYSQIDPNGKHLFYVEVEAGTNAGLRVDITASDGAAAELTLMNDVSALVSAGDQIKVREYYGIADVFGAANESGLTAGSSSSDFIYVIDTEGSYTPYYYQVAPPFAGGTGWRKLGNISNSMADARVYGGALLLVRSATTAKPEIKITLSGNVNMNQSRTGIYAGINLVANQFPIDTTLGNSNLYVQGNSNSIQGGSTSTADLVYLMSATTGALTPYYYQIAPPFAGGNGWRQFGNTTADQSSAVIGAGTSLIVVKQGSANNWIRPQPF